MKADQLPQLNALRADIETFIAAAAAQNFNCTILTIIAEDERAVYIYNDGEDPNNLGQHILRIVSN